MNEAQFRQALKNSRRYAPRELLGGEMEAGFLRTAARQLKQRERVTSVLRELVEPEWLRFVNVCGTANGTVTLLLEDAVAAAALRRQATRLGKQLARRVPGVRNVRIASPSDVLPGAVDD